MAHPHHASGFRVGIASVSAARGVLTGVGPSVAIVGSVRLRVDRASAVNNCRKTTRLNESMRDLFLTGFGFFGLGGSSCLAFVAGRVSQELLS